MNDKIIRESNIRGYDLRLDCYFACKYFEKFDFQKENFLSENSQGNHDETECLKNVRLGQSNDVSYIMQLLHRPVQYAWSILH